VPSGFFKAMTNTAAPGFNRLISPGALARIGTSGPMLYSDSPPVKVRESSAAAALPANGKSSLTLPNEVRDPIRDVVLDELVERVLADETLRPNDFEPKSVTR
jgi:hypothetical protein